MIDGNAPPDLWTSLLDAVAEDAAGHGLRVPSGLGRRLQRSTGHALPREVTERVCAILGGDLTEVKLHVGPASDEILDRLDARACCLGRDILLKRSTLGAAGTAARALLHELAHIAAGPRADRVRCWDARDHGDLSVLACMPFRIILEPLARSVDLSWMRFLVGVRNASSNMDFRGRAGSPSIRWATSSAYPRGRAWLMARR